MGVEEDEVDAQGKVGVARGEGVHLTEQALFLVGMEGKVGAFGAGAGFDFNQDEEVAFLEEEVGLGDGAERAGRRVVAVGEKVAEGNQLADSALEVGVEVSPGFQAPGGGLGKPGRGR